MTDQLSISDRLDIADLLVRYATGIDRRDWVLFRACFTNDFIGDYGVFGKWMSVDEITEAMIASHDSVGPTLHRLSNMAVTPSGGGALARSYVDAVLMPLETSGTVSQATGFYDDTIVKIAGEWKIATRKFTMVRLRQHANGDREGED